MASYLDATVAAVAIPPSVPSLHSQNSSPWRSIILDTEERPQMDADQFRSAAHAAIEEIIQYYQSLPDRRVLPAVSPGYLRPQLPRTAPAHGEPWSQIQADISRLIVPGLTHWQSPNFMAFFPAHSSFPGMLGELYSAAFTAPAFNWLCSPACTELETVVLDWLARALGLPDAYLSEGSGGGVIQGSASEAIVTVMVAARERALRQAGVATQQEAEERADALRGKLVALGSEQAHSSTQKAAIIAGTRFRSIPAGRATGYALTGAALRTALQECTAAGLVPYYLTVTLGTTSTCAVDRFDEIEEVIKDYPEVWVHVDAAYAGAALVCEEYHHHASHFDVFDSFDMNMHKWLLTNFDASCLFVRNRSDLTRALSITPSYLRNAYSDRGLVTDYRDWQIPLGRRFRSLKIWFVLRTYGTEGLKRHIRNHVTWGEQFAGWVKERDDLFEHLAGPSFALNVIAVRPAPRRRARDAAAAGPANRAGGDSGAAGAAANGAVDPVEEAGMQIRRLGRDPEYRKAANAVTGEVYELINHRGEIFLTSGVVGGVYAIRVVAATPHVEERHVRKAYDILVSTAEEVRSRREKNAY